MLKASALRWLAALVTIVILIATLTFAVGSATGTDAETSGVWRQLLPVALVMGFFGAVVVELSLLSPLVPAHSRNE
jgi:hypothetical protein